MRVSIVAGSLLSVFVGGCGTPPPKPAPPVVIDWAIAIHGGAGVPQLTPAEETAYRTSMKAALSIGRDMLRRGATGLDTVETVVRYLEDNALFNAGKGAVYTADRRHELDASIMDGATLSCGAVTGVRTVQHPITLARRVMEKSEHVFFSGAGAERFATTMAVARVPNSYFDTPRRLRQLQKKLGDAKGTVGCVVRDRHGNLAVATSTGGMTAKKFGRIGDSPVIGAGCYASNKSCAVAGTGHGEQFIRHTVARDVAARMEFGGRTLEQAAHEVVFEVLDSGDGGIIAVDKKATIAMPFNSEGMFRGAADSTGRFEIRIWQER